MSLILHHYDFSNFAEKARLMLGFKGLAWLSVEQPPILPKPKLVPLTGGYRRIPILQDGADLWCDTRLIAHELERRVPSPTFFPDGTRGHGEAIAWWAEQQFMRPSALFVSGINADHMPEGLHDDRARLHGLPPPSIEAVRAAAIRNRPSRAAADRMAGADARRRTAVPAGRQALHRRLRRLSRRLVLSRPPHRLPRRVRSLSQAPRLARPHGHDRPRHAHRDEPGRGARRRAPRVAGHAAPLRSAGRRSQAGRARPRAAVGQCARLDRGRGAVHRRRRDRAAAQRSRRRRGRRPLPAAGLRLAAA